MKMYKFAWFYIENWLISKFHYSKEEKLSLKKITLIFLNFYNVSN